MKFAKRKKLEAYHNEGRMKAAHLSTPVHVVKMILANHSQCLLLGQLVLHRGRHRKSAARRSPEKLVERLVGVLLSEMRENAVSYRRSTKIPLRDKYHFQFLLRTAAIKNFDWHFVYHSQSKRFNWRTRTDEVAIASRALTAGVRWK